MAQIQQTVKQTIQENTFHYFGKHKNASYLHICEGAPDLDNTTNNHLTGKLIAYLITDFIKSKTL